MGVHPIQKGVALPNNMFFLLTLCLAKYPDHVAGKTLSNAPMMYMGGMFARCATFLLTIPTSAPDIPSDGEGPPNRP